MNPIRLSATFCLIACLSACATDPNQQNQNPETTQAAADANKPAQAPIVSAVPTYLTPATSIQYLDQLQREIEHTLATNTGNSLLEIERQDGNLIKLIANNAVSFDFNQSEVKPDFIATLERLVDPMQRFSLTMVTVVGHTDSTGDATYNLDLSLKRADAVGSHLLQTGIPSDRLTIEGHGESEPRSSNATAAGRELNRRVEILIQPIVVAE